MSLRRRSRVSAWVRRSLLLLFVLATIFPFYYAVLNSFRHIRNVPDLSWVPTGLTLDNWIAAFGPDSPMPRWLFNSVVVTLTITTLSLCFDSLAGYAFARKQFPGKNLFFFGVVIFGLTVPAAIVIIPVYTMMAKANLINTYLALILPAASSLGTFMMTQAISDIPVELDEAARLDGSSDFGIFRRIILPLSKPALAAVFIVLFLAHWNSFLYPLIVTNKMEMRTLPVGLYLLSPGGDQTFGLPPPWGLITVIIAIQFVPVLIIFLIFQDYFTQGMALTGMK
jgi:multiple sugar transport system permease protein